MGRVIGVDLGTTNSCVAILENNEPVVLSNKEGLRTTPSVVAFSKNGERLVGAVAKRQAAVNVDRTFFSIKRAMGSDYRVRVDGKSYSAPELSAMILRKIKKDVEEYLNEEVTDAVITVPAYFNDAQRQATKDAGKIAGLNVLRIINEPTAAALAYGLDHGVEQKILVYDLGGGTFDVSVIEIGDNLIEVLATAGDNHLGGDDFDERLAEYMLAEFNRTERIDLRKDAAACQRVREEAERVKKVLSCSSTATVNLPFITMAEGEPLHMEMPITRLKFNELTKDLVERTTGPVMQALNDAGLKPSDISSVLLVGGSTRMPVIVDKVRNMMGREPSHSLNPDECVALGAAVQSGKLGGELMAGSAAAELILMDVTPLSLSIETVGGVSTRLIDRNTTIPASFSKIFSTAANFQTAVDIKILQGERKFARDNKLLGSFQLRGIRPAPAGVPQIEVTFDIDVNGIVQVSAKDLGTGKRQQITITASSNLSDAEIERAIQDAKEYEEMDGKRTAFIDRRLEAERVVIQVEQAFKMNKKQLDSAARRQIKSNLGYTKRLLNRIKPGSITEEQAMELARAVEELQASASAILNT